MQPVTDLFLASLRYSHIGVTTCELTFPEAPAPVEVPVEAGQIRIDRTAQNRRAGSITIPWSLQAGNDLGLDLRTLTLGGYARIRRGLRYPSGDTETVLLGTLRVESVSWDTLDASASLELADRMAQIRDEPFTAPYDAHYRTPMYAATAIVQAVFGATISYLYPYNPAGSFGDNVFYTGDRAAALSDIEQAYGAEIYFDADGNFVFDQKPGDDEPVVWTIDAGETGVMVNARENLDRTGIYNGVLVQGQATADQAPISALATYDEPSSPLRWGGPFGKVALIADSSSATTAGQAAAAAQSLLNLRLKQTRSLEIITVPNPALEAGDTIAVLFNDGRSEHHLIDAVTTDLSTGAQSIITRGQFTPATAPALAEARLDHQLFYGQQAWRELHDAEAVSFLVSAPASRSLENVLRQQLATAPPLRLIIGTYAAAPADGRYANVTVGGQALTIPKIKGIPNGTAGQPAYILATTGQMLAIGTVAT